jgi:selenocysteine lyase/cysteine desulfurase
VREDLAQRLPNQSHFFHEPKPHRRLVPSGPDHAQVAAVNGVVDYMEALWAHQGGHENGSAAGVADLFEAQEKALMTPLLDWLNNRAGVRLIGRRDAAGRAPTISISVDGRKPADLAAELAEHRIAVGFGHFYAYRLMDALGIDPADGVLRLSMVHYNTGEDVERTIAALDAVI